MYLQLGACTNASDREVFRIPLTVHFLGPTYLSIQSGSDGFTEPARYIRVLGAPQADIRGCGIQLTRNSLSTYHGHRISLDLRCMRLQMACHKRCARALGLGDVIGGGAASAATVSSYQHSGSDDYPAEGIIAERWPRRCRRSGCTWKGIPGESGVPGISMLSTQFRRKDEKVSCQSPFDNEGWPVRGNPLFDSGTDAGEGVRLFLV